MKSYNHNKIESKWQELWEEQAIYKVFEDKDKPKYYVLDMFPYPSGSGLHVGHPLGYVAADIFSRYKKLKGFNVLHPMGYDSFGLPAEQYAIQTGAHPADTTANNIKRYKEQLDKLGFNYDWSRKVVTSDPSYYKWTQWIFIQIFNSWYDKVADRARPIEELIKIFEKEGNKNIKAYADEDIEIIDSKTWIEMGPEEQYKFLLKYRLAYLSDIKVNWCPELGTVLANEEVKDGLSERGGYPVIRKNMNQWSLRITAFADRLLEDLKLLDWSDSLKEIQKNWIGRSKGVEFDLYLENNNSIKNKEIISNPIRVFTTRPDTIYGVTFLAIAPEHPLLGELKLSDKVVNYIQESKNRSEINRSKEIDNIRGIYTGYNVIHPLTKEILPIWVADYVLWGYGTGAVIGVPGHDIRDYDFAKYFDIPIKEVVEGGDIAKEAFMTKEGKIINSDFLNGLSVNEAIYKAIEKIESLGIGKSKINYRLRDAIFSRQRYWGEPFPVYYKNNISYVLDEKELPLELPKVDNYKPTPQGDPPLGNAKNWKTKDDYPLELNTMPGWAGSSWYFLRYMDNMNSEEFVSKEKQEYWKNVDLYIGGAEHATGHLLYSRFWTKFLYDIGYIDIKEPFKKLINQGMIQGISQFVFRIKGTNTFVSYNLRKEYQTSKLHVEISFVKNNILDIDKFRNWRSEFKDSKFILEYGKYVCGSEIEKMSKSKYNTVTPDDVIDKYGADTLRLYSMFLGPLEHSKPWSMDGIEGVYRFLSKVWKLFFDEDGNKVHYTDKETNPLALKAINKLIKKIQEDIERYSFNTCVSSFMICINELITLKCKDKDILEKFLICLAPFAPHICEELWSILKEEGSIINAVFPTYDNKYLMEDSYEYPIAVNGKTKFKLSFQAGLNKEQIEDRLLKNDRVIKQLKDQKPKKIIIIDKRMINIVM
ncbi:MAG: leucine--tRNA ligase [Bacteroidetes bacterium]|nr:leucine--tRNA ligase [Bacteroidota bacterium]